MWNAARHAQCCVTGGGGAGGGSSSLDSLMDQMPFGPRPKVVDLTSDANRLASKLQEAVLKCDERHRDELLYYLLVRPSTFGLPSFGSCFVVSWFSQVESNRDCCVQTILRFDSIHPEAPSFCCGLRFEFKGLHMFSDRPTIQWCCWSRGPASLFCFR